MNTEHKFNGRRFWWRKALLLIVLIPVGILLFGYIVMTLWNFTLPQTFGIGAITFWQAIGILILSKILFGGFRGGWGGRHHYAKQARWKEKWAGMTEEERVQYRERLQQWCRQDPQTTKPEAPGEAPS